MGSGWQALVPFEGREPFNAVRAEFGKAGNP